MAFSRRRACGDLLVMILFYVVSGWSVTFNFDRAANSTLCSTTMNCSTIADIVLYSNSTDTVEIAVGLTLYSSDIEINSSSSTSFNVQNVQLNFVVTNGGRATFDGGGTSRLFAILSSSINVRIHRFVCSVLM
jgi:hypothetical protein